MIIKKWSLKIIFFSIYTVIFSLALKKWRCILALRDEDQTCSTTDDLTSNKFEQPPPKNKDRP